MNFKKIHFLILLSLSIFIQVLTFQEKYSSREYIRTKEELDELINSQEFIDYMSIKELNENSLTEKECLMPKDDSINTLINSYGINNPNPDENLRFILGKCSPVLLIPGIYSTKFVAEFQCENIATYEKDTTLKNLRVYCGDSVCQDETKELEEHALFMGILDNAFTIVGDMDKYSTCLGHVMNYFQNPNECPSVGDKSLCHYSKYIKIGYYGCSAKTLKDSRCGVESIQNIIQTGKLKIDNVINFGASKCFATLSKTLINRGYKEGFSFGALPNDYRRFLGTNNFAEKVFERQINRLYKNTGKPVVIVAHSYGTLLALTNLIKKQSDTTFIQKIKKFVALGPPFAGATKLLDAFLHGLNEWNTEIEILKKKIRITDYNKFGQLLMYKTLPTITELRPQSIASKIFTEPKYSVLAKAISDRINTERECRKTNCPINTLKIKTATFDKIFKDYFPSLIDEECAYESRIGGNTDTYARKCYTNLYNVGQCPMVITKSENPTQSGLDDNAYCGKTGANYYYLGECTNGLNCLDDIYSAENKCPYVFNNHEAVDYLLNRFNKKFSSQYGTLDKNYFDTYDQIRAGVKKTIEYQMQQSVIKDLPLPPVDTDLVYASFLKTTSMLVVNDNDFSLNGNELDQGGDSTVPAWSSLLTGLKWIYEMKNDSKYKKKIRLIEYCSRLAANGQYKYDPTREQKFAALGCSCINNNNFYESSISNCTHSSMMNEENLINYVISIVDDPKDTVVVTDGKKTAANNYKESYNYENECNIELKNILETAE